MKTYPVFDSNVFLEYQSKIEEYADIMRLSSIVLYELTATSIDDRTLQRFDIWRKTANQDSCLLTPTMIDYWETANAVRRLRFLKQTSKTTTPTELQNDALISRTAWRNNCFVVTPDIDDFAYLQKVMPKLDVIPASVFFG